MYTKCGDLYPAKHIVYIIPRYVVNDRRKARGAPVRRYCSATPERHAAAHQGPPSRIRPAQQHRKASGCVSTSCPCFARWRWPLLKRMQAREGGTFARPGPRARGGEGIRVAQEGQTEERGRRIFYIFEMRWGVRIWRQIKTPSFSVPSSSSYDFLVSSFSPLSCPRKHSPRWNYYPPTTHYWSMSIAAGSPMAPVARKRQRNEVGGSSPTSIIPETSPHQEIGGQQKDQFSISNQPYTCRGRSAWQSIGRRRSCTSITLTSARVQPPTAAARRSFSSNGAEFEFGGAEDVETSAGPATPTNAVEGTPRRQLRGFQKRREELRQTGALAVPSFVPSAGFASPIVYPLEIGLVSIVYTPLPHLCCCCCCCCCCSIPHGALPLATPLLFRTQVALVPCNHGNSCGAGPTFPWLRVPPVSQTPRQRRRRLPATPPPLSQPASSTYTPT